MGMDPISFSEALTAVIAQRLVRMLCQKCKKSFKQNKEEYEEMRTTYGTDWFEKHDMDKAFEKATMMQKVGCKECDQVGYRGRTAIYELLQNTDKIKHGIKEKASTDELRLLAMEKGMRTLRMDGVEKVIEGVTDLSEILRVC